MRTGMIQISGLSHKRINQSDPMIAWWMFHRIYCMYSDIKNKKKEILLCYSQVCQNTKSPKKLTKNSDTHAIRMIKINLSYKKLSYLLISMISNQDPLSYETTMKLGLIQTEDGSRSSVLTKSFKVNKNGKYKLENEHNSFACYLSLTEMMGNASCHPSLCTNPIITPNIFTITSHWTV